MTTPAAGGARGEPAATPQERSLVRRVVGLVTTLLVAAGFALWFVTLRPIALGGPAQYVVVRGNSMEPTYQPGDLVITHTGAAYSPGDVIAYRVPKGEIGEGKILIHRIVGGSGATGLDVRGDHNNGSDPWHPRQADVVGSAWIQLPGLGRLLLLTHQPLVPATVAGVVAAVWRYRSRRRRGRGSEASGGVPQFG